MNKFKLTICCALSLLATVSIAQKGYDEDLSEVRPIVEFDEGTDLVEEPKEIIIENDQTEEVEQTLEAYAEYVANIKCAKGYRIQIYLGKSDKEVQEVKEQLKEIEGFEEADVYVEYKVNFRVKVGNYTQRLDAHRDLVKLQKVFDRALLLPENCIPIEKVK